jgi:predicted site-specific integrase-resolvase
MRTQTLTIPQARRRIFQQTNILPHRQQILTWLHDGTIPATYNPNAKPRWRIPAHGINQIVNRILAQETALPSPP